MLKHTSLEAETIAGQKNNLKKGFFSSCKTIVCSALKRKIGIENIQQKLIVQLKNLVIKFY